MEIPRGEITRTVYNLIKEEKHTEAIEILEQLLEMQPCSRAALSLLGHCYFYLQEFGDSAFTYERLVKLYPEVLEYRLYFVQSLYHASLYEQALEACIFPGDTDGSSSIDRELQEQFLKLKAAVQYCCDETTDAKCLLERCSQFDTDTVINRGCIEYKNGNFHQAQKDFETAAKSTGFDSKLWYNRAVTAYRLMDIPSTAHFVGEIIQFGVLEYPQLGVSSVIEGWEGIASVGNTRDLHESALVEALNLKAAIEFDLGKVESAKKSMTDLPPRNEEELDAISLHNNAILNVKKTPVETLKKLRYLLDQDSFPPETFQNLMIIYSTFEQYDLMADLMAVYEDHKGKYLSPFLSSFFEALIKRDTSSSEALKMFEKLCTQLSDNLRKFMKQMDDCKTTGEEEVAKKVLGEFDEIIAQCYLPTIMQIGKIHWDNEDWSSVEKTLHQGKEFCDDRDCWLLNAAHVFYIRGQDYAEAINFYETVTRKNYDKLLEVSAMVLANLSNSYILVQSNDDAEDLIQQIETQEEDLLSKCPDIKMYHSCIVNLVIGTMYCVKKNYSFGISRMMKSLSDNFPVRLGPDTWHYAKRCLLSMLVEMTKHKLEVDKSLLKECTQFLVSCEHHGISISSVVEEANPLTKEKQLPSTYGEKTVAYEARYLRWLLYKFLEL